MPQPIADDRKQLTLAIAALAGAEHGFVEGIRQKYAQAKPLLSGEERCAVNTLLGALESSQQYIVKLSESLAIQTVVNQVERRN